MTLKERMAAGGCRACPSLRSSRSKVFCDVHLEQATRSARKSWASRKGTGRHQWLTKGLVAEMKMLRADGMTYRGIAEVVGCSAMTVLRHLKKIQGA